MKNIHINYRSLVKYAIVMLWGGLIMMQPVDSQASIRQILVHTVISVAVFAIVLVFDVVWPPPGGDGHSTRPSLTWLFVLAGVLLCLSFLGPWFLLSLQTNPSLAGVVVRLIEAGNGFFLPILMLVIFSVVVLLRRRHFHG